MSSLLGITNLIGTTILPTQTGTGDIKGKKDKMVRFVENSILPKLEEAERLMTKREDKYKEIEIKGNEYKPEFSNNLKLLRNLVKKNALVNITNQKQYSEHRKKVLNAIDTMDKLYKKALDWEIDNLRKRISNKTNEAKEKVKAKKDRIDEMKIIELEDIYKLIGNINNLRGEAKSAEKFEDLVKVKNEIPRKWNEFAKLFNKAMGFKKKVQKKPVKKSPSPNIPSNRPNDIFAPK